MIKEVIVTGWSTQGWNEYAKRITSTWRENIPEYIDLIAYVDDDFDENVPDFTLRKLSEIPGYTNFINTHKKNPLYNGMKVPERPGNSPKEYDYRWDVIKWARQAFIPYNAMRHNVEYLYWFDADVEFYKKLPNDFLISLFGDADTMVYLGRDNLHSDIGFFGCDTSALAFLLDWKTIYEHKRFSSLKEWHSAFTFDYTMNKWKEIYNVKNLTAGKPLGPEKSIWEQSPLYPYCFHQKGMWKFKNTDVKKNDQIERL